MTKGRSASGRNTAQKLGYRTPDFFRGQVVGGSKQPVPKFNPAQFRTQHKG